MSQSDDYRAQAKLSFEIANCLSDKVAAERVRDSARKSLRVADRLTQMEEGLSEIPIVASSRETT
jgi:hypothetical protein